MKNNNGFTLIEMMITVAIIGILVSIAVPSYQQYIIKTRRVDVQQIITSQAQALERYFTVNGKYTNGGSTCGVVDVSNIYYTITSNCADANEFKITATPVTGKSQATDGNITLTNTGARTGTWIN